MTRHRVLRSGALRLAVLFTVLFAAGAVAYVGVVHYSVRRFARTSLEASIEAEVALVGGEERRGRDAVALHFKNDRRFLYSVSDPDGARRAGTLPPGADRVGWHTISIPATGTPDDPEDESVDVLTLGSRLEDGSLLVVGRSLFAAGEVVEWLDQAALWTALGIVGLALGGSWLIASVFLRRLDRVNDAIGRIMGGAFKERIPPIGMGAEFDRLTAQLNAMLDRILALMEGHRQLSTTIAHDLRTPLTRLRQRLEATRDASAAPVARDDADAVIRDLDEVLATFAALLRLGTIETGALRARFRPVALDLLLRRTQAAFAPVAEDRGKTLVAGALAEATLMGDAELLTQLVTNLVENALLHTPRGILVSLALRIEGDEAVVAVSDDGPGIPEAERANVLRRFYRLEASRETSGAGLGLALVNAIVMLHQGRLVLSDNAPGLTVMARFSRGGASVGGATRRGGAVGADDGERLDRS